VNSPDVSSCHGEDGNFDSMDDEIARMMAEGNPNDPDAGRDQADSKRTDENTAKPVVLPGHTQRSHKKGGPLAA
jgi:hypothetical protein